MANKKKVVKKQSKPTTTKKKEVKKEETKKKVVKEEIVEEELEDEELEEEEIEEELVDEELEEETEDEYEEDEELEVNKQPKDLKWLKTVCIVLGCLLGFFIISVILPEPKNDIEENETVEETQPSVSEWLEDTKSGDTVVTVIGSSTCPHCQEYKPVITALAEEKGFKLYFFEIDLLGEEDQTTLTSTYDLSTYEGYVPYTFIISKGKFVKDTTGYSDEDTTIKFLQDNKVIKKN